MSQRTSTVSSGVAQDPHWDQCYSKFHNEMYSENECTLRRFADHSKLNDAVDAPEGHNAIQRNLEKFKEWVCENLRSLNKAKNKVLLHQGNARHQYSLGDELLESSPAEKDLGVLMDEKQDKRWQCAFVPLKSSCILGCIKSRYSQQVGSCWRVILPLCSALVRPHLESCVYLWGPQHRKDLELE
ncbi:rna-directed dna polymerase from mobile element jockey-like [Willisornis vidua]|uniref:Rna-directed dna polymerase from mobile element jockey-like n=1 Tax=Willisornis vidua TaxID=1566151 RepID=A0ABQ9D564_9PASS|nr:rna-directed dna polymerase from mobile element jockey-like [Willisornis vidua]